jgi:hypothetical protein
VATPTEICPQLTCNIDNAAALWPDKPTEKLRIISGYERGAWNADLVCDGDLAHPLLETGWHQELITPDSAYVLLMQMTAMQVVERKKEAEQKAAREREAAMATAEPEGSVIMADSGDESD